MITCVLTQLGFVIRFLWVPAHIGIASNENADYLANLSSSIKIHPYIKIPYSDIILLLKECFKIKRSE